MSNVESQVFTPKKFLLLIMLHCYSEQARGRVWVGMFFLWFPCIGVRLVYWSLRSTTTFVICFHWSLLLVFSLHFASSSAFLRSLFMQSSHLSCGLPRFLKPSCFFVSDLFGNLFHSDHVSCPFHPVLNYFANYTSFSSNFFSQIFHSPSLHSHYAGYSPYPVVRTYL